MKRWFPVWALTLCMVSAPVLAGQFEVMVIESTMAEDRSAGVSFAGIVTEPRRPVYGAAELALTESKPSFDALGVTSTLARLDLDPNQPVSTQLNHLTPFQLLILDLPEPLYSQAVAALANRGLVVINVRHTQSALRDSACQPHVFHTIPSDRMYFDALGQFVIYRGWRKVLVVHDPTPMDQQRTEALIESLKKFGANVVDRREFTLSHHPDDRDHNQPEFLTGGASYDAVAVIDTNRDYGRSIQFSTRQPRPVIGDVGLTPRAWHPALERYGAPQLNQRYQAMRGIEGELIGMSDSEFATWAAVKYVTNTLGTQHLATEHLDLRALFTDPEGRVDLYKGTRGSFRVWNQQLRQPMLLAAESAVIAVAPMPKFLHPKHYVDTLGLDQPESQCRL
jgi:ABC transporter substrate binding protein (PQQ-dependent alcohol dehydrogenase system)